MIRWWRSFFAHILEKIWIFVPSNSLYLDSSKKPAVRTLPETVIYPFGLNQSQKTAVENALSSQISIIQGPPGTGKTQTILNIIANAVRNGQTVAVVSNNNSATLNVAEKLEKKGLSFLTAFLGSRANKEHFLEAQTGQYPDMSAWVLETEEKSQLDQEVTVLSKELSEMLNGKNRIAAIEQELLQLTPEQHYFGEYYSTYAQAPKDAVKGLSSQKILSLWLEYEQYAQQESKLGLLQKISILFRFNRSALKVFLQAPELVIPYLQRQFYVVRRQELMEERAQLEKKLEQYAFNQKMEELTEKSLRLFRAELSEKFHWKESRQCFEMRDFRGKSKEFNQEYPVILSTTYSIKGTLNFEHTYDYLIVDEASQVDLATGVLAFASAKNIVIVGDLQQLPNVLDNQNIQKREEIWRRYSLPETYHFSAHSLLSSAIATWPEAPIVLLREHYRCHPKIINFCNQKFYGGKLIVMTEDHEEPDVLTMYRTAPGNHARGHLNQRQIDVIRQEVLPSLERQGYGSIGIITPYRDQVVAIQTQLGKELEVATVHKFQGREKDAIVLTSVDNVITGFVDDPRMLNVAVSRAVKSLTVITSQDPQNDRTNYGDLARYIEYNNCAVIESTVYSVFDLLYRGYAEQRRDFLKKHGRVSEYDSENFAYAVIRNMLQKAEFVWEQEHYYLVAINPEHVENDQQRNYRIDRMRNVAFDTGEWKRINKFGFSYGQFDMFSSKEKRTVTFRVHRDLLDMIFGTFGTHIICHPDDTRPNWIIFVAEVELSGGFDRWVLRQTDKLEVLAPPSVRNRIYQLLQNIIASYRE